MAIQLPFGKQDGELKHISDVERGLKCECICPACETPLVARKGEKTAHHFAHYQAKSCDGAVETALHWAAKNVLAVEKRIRLPETLVQFNSFREPFTLCKPGYLSFDNVWLEQTMETIIPDVLIEKNGRRLALEIKVTHEVDEEKKITARDNGISVLEIDLSDLQQEITPDLVREITVDNLEYKTWVYNRRAQRYHDRLIQAARRRWIRETGMEMYVRDCPLEYRSDDDGFYALVIDDCWHCRHCLNHDRQEGIIYCGANEVEIPY